MPKVFQAVAVAAFVIPLIVAVVAGAAIANGFLIYLYWGWFVQPVFAGIPSLTLAQSIGLAATASLLANGVRVPEKKKQTSEEATTELLVVLGLMEKKRGQKNLKAAIELVVVYGLIALFGWAVHLFV